MEELLNRTINDRYTILSLVGKGGMAAVYKAYDVVDAREVAIKILDREFLGDEDMRNRFSNEAKAIASVSHPNIVNIYDYYCDENLAFIVMEYVNGISLKDYMKNVGVIEPKDAVHFTVQLLRALQHAHDAGIYHRDIKPENIMILPNASVKVSDFGIAKLTHGRGIEIEDGRNFGSVRYMSPEQINNAMIDSRSDIYSVGVLLYELVTGRLPFDSQSDEEVALMQLTQQPTRPMIINPNIPVGLEQIILHAMQKNPSYRFSSAADFLVDINEFRKNPNVVFDYLTEKAEVEEIPVVTTPVQDENPTKSVVAPKIPVDTAAEEPSLTDEYDEEEYDDDDEYYDDDDDDGSSHTKVIVAAVAVLVAVVGVIALIFVIGNRNRGLVEVPNFINMEFEAAIAKYPDLIIQNPPAYSYNSTYEDGRVCAQEPAEGTKIVADTVIKLTVAASSDSVLIQDASGMTFEEAEAMYKSEGLEVVLVPVTNDDKKEGEVISTSPSANTFTKRSNTVYVYYASSDASEALVKVPEVTGYDLYAAQAKIEAAGLKLGSVTSATSSESMKGCVISQSPSGNAQIRSGGQVSVIIGAGGAEDETVSGNNTASFNITLPSMSTSGTIKIKLNGSVYDTKSGVSFNGGSYSVSITGSGESNNFEIYANDNLIYSGTINFTTQTPTISNVQVNQFTGKAYVPAVTGLTKDAAVEALKDAGFMRVKVQTQNSDSVPAGQVMSQSPDSSAKQATTTTVTIVVSAGPAATEAPTSSEPVTEATTAAPVTEAPVTEAPVTEAPVTDEEYF